MSHSHSQASGVVLHGSRSYDVVFGRFVRTTDAEILSRAEVAAGDRVLDVGTGPGYLALAASGLVAPGGRAVGIDASREMIDRARGLAARRGSKAEYLVASAESLPFEDDSFDVVVSRLVFHHLPGDVKLQALSEMARVLRPGGRLLVVDLASPTARGAHHIVAHILGTKPDSGAVLEELVSGAGFTQLTHGRLMHGMLAGVAARSPESAAQG
jgi:demethylmenaquinone methyltransferase/2-methoxy-6-polyprenyl-1,4-benzoquinol methylase/phosphoethanolamine N-methyltransferase